MLLFAVVFGIQAEPGVIHMPVVARTLTSDELRKAALLLVPKNSEGAPAGMPVLRSP